MAYTTANDVRVLAARDLSAEDAILSTAVITQWIGVAASELDRVVGVDYVLPITRANSPVSFAVLKADNEIGALYYLYSLLQDLSEGDEGDNPWQAKWEASLARLAEDNALPDAPLRYDMDMPAATTVNQLITAAIAEEQRLKSVSYNAGTHTLTFVMVNPGGQESSFDVTLPSDEGTFNAAQVASIVRQVLDTDILDGNHLDIDLITTGLSPQDVEQVQSAFDIFSRSDIQVIARGEVAEWARTGQERPTGGGTGGTPAPSGPQDGDIRYWVASASRLQRYDGGTSTWVDLPATGGGGGGAASGITQHSTGTFNWSAPARQFKDPVSAIDLPNANEAMWILIEFSDAQGAHEAHWIDEDILLGLPSATAGDAVSSTNAIILPDSGSSGTVDVWLGHDGNNLLMAQSRTSGTNTVQVYRVSSVGSALSEEEIDARITELRPDPKDNEVRYKDASPSDLERYDGTAWHDVPTSGLTTAQVQALGYQTQPQVDARVAALDKGIKFVGTALPAAASYNDNDLAWINGDGLYELVEATEKSNTLAAVAWTPVKRAPSMFEFGFEARSGETAFGTRPTGWPTTIQAMFRDSVNNIWFYATTGTFGTSTTDAIELIVDGLTLHLPFHRTDSGIDTYVLGPLSNAPWSEASIQIGIHALGGLTPFTAATKSWSKQDSIGDQATAKLLAGGREATSRISWTLNANHELIAAIKPTTGDIRYDDSSPSDLERWTGSAWQDIPAQDAGLDTDAVDARIAQPARAGDTSRWPLNKTDPKLEQLADDIRAGGWGYITGMDVTEPSSGPYNATSVKAAAYKAVGDDTGSLLQNQNVGVRLPKTQFESQPVTADFARLRMRRVDVAIIEEQPFPFTGATYLDDDATYWYYNFPIAQIPAGSNLNMQYDSPSELVDVDVPVEDVVGLDERIDSRIPEPVQTAAVIAVHDGAINSPNLTDFSSTHLGGHTAFTPSFSLDTHAAGFFEVEIDISIATGAISSPASRTLSFTADRTTTQANLTGLLAASVLAATEDFVAGGTHEGVEVARQGLYSRPAAGAGAKLGDFILRLSHDSSNNVAWDWDYEPASGAPTTTGSATFTSALEVAFQKSDVAASGGDEGGGSGGGPFKRLAYKEILTHTGTLDFTSQITDTPIIDSDYDKIWLLTFYTKFSDTSFQGGRTGYSLIFPGQMFQASGTQNELISPYVEADRFSNTNGDFRASYGNFLFYSTQGNRNLSTNIACDLFIQRTSSNHLNVRFKAQSWENPRNRNNSGTWNVYNLTLLAIDPSAMGGGGGGSGLDQSGVDGRIRALVADYAEEGDSAEIPRAKGNLIAPLAVPLVQADTRVYASATGNTISQATFQAAAGNRVRMEGTVLMELAAGTTPMTVLLTYLLPGDSTETTIHTSSGQRPIVSTQAEVRQLTVEGDFVVPADKGGEVTVKVKIMSTETTHSALDRTLKCTVFR